MKKDTPVKRQARGYAAWIAELKRRYRATQIMAAVAVNSALIEFYWNLGKDIAEKYPGEVYGSKFFEKLSSDLRQAIPEVRGFSKVNLTYCLRFLRCMGQGRLFNKLLNNTKATNKANRHEHVDSHRMGLA